MTQSIVFLWLFTVVAGFVSAGFVGSLWALFMGERPRLWLLGERNLALPLAIGAVVLHMPLTLFETGVNRFMFGRPFGFTCVASGLVWCFLQGVFVLNQVFGLT